MINSDSYEVFPLPVLPIDAHIHDYATLRLSSLQMNPECFSSTYERESAFTNAQWKEKIDSMGKGTIIVSTLPQKDEIGILECKWVGMASIMGPDILRTIPSESLGLPDTVSYMLESTYIMVGVWVHPKHRHRGLGKKLVDGCFDWVRRNENKIDGNLRKILLLKVYRSNENAIALYERMGFQQVPLAAEVTVRGGDTQAVWMAANVESQGETAAVS